MNRYLRWKIDRLLQELTRSTGEASTRVLWRRLKRRVADYFGHLAARMNEQDQRKAFAQVFRSADGKESAFTVRLLAATFLDVDTLEFLQGGAERYVLALDSLVRSMGGCLEVFQCGRSPWRREVHGVTVYGFNTHGYDPKELNRLYHRWVPPADLTIYFQMALSTPQVHKPAICVSHGIDWDAPWLHQQPGGYRRALRRTLASVRNVNRLISVDTNTINWMRATAPELAAKCLYLPNFVDLGVFHPAGEAAEGLSILYPRRLSEARGYWQFAQRVPDLLARYPSVRIDFCGRAEPLEKLDVTRLCLQYPKRVRWFDASPERMPEVYRRVGLVVIPTRYSEGTSLSCLEALASGKAVIATNVGGLADLILPDFNGLLIEPDEAALYAAICRLIDDPGLRERLAANGLQTAQAFGLATWQARWEQVIRQTLPPGKVPRE